MKNHAPLETGKAGRPTTDGQPATGHIHLRVTLARKGWYVRTARLYNQTLAEWMQRKCDAASGYPPKSQLVTANRHIWPINAPRENMPNLR